MRVTTRGLRRWIVGTAGLLLLVVAGFVIYGRNRFRHIEKDLPGRLGISIQSTSSTITFSQSTQGHTLFTLKAAKQVQMKSGHVLLHDVDITLYGPPGSGRKDRIAGTDFDYDQTQGVIISQGEVEIELQGAGKGAPNGDDGDTTANTMRVKTSGLTFLQKTGEASTQQQVEFELPRAAGTAVGADYNAKTGVVVLDRAVHITSSTNGKAAVVDATHATLLRESSQAQLMNAKVNYQNEDASSDQAVVNFRRDGTAEKIDAQGHVWMRTDDGATVNAESAHILLDTKSQPTRADLAGGVQFASARDGAMTRGTSGNGTLLFAAMNAGGHAQSGLRHAEFRQDVRFTQNVTGLAKDPRGHVQKEMQAQKLNVDFAPARSGGGVEARKAIAEGRPVITSRQMPSKGPEETTRISGDRLIATLGEGNALQQLDGTGNTQIVQSATDGARNTIRGDVLHASFVQEASKGSAGKHTAAGDGTNPPDGPRMETTLETATQDGNVVLTETPAKKPITPNAGEPGMPAKKPGIATQPETLTGWAQHAEYQASEQVLHLTGSPRISDGATMQLAADQIDYHRDTQNAAATGHVKATYTQASKGGENPNSKEPPTMGGSGPVHVIAERATLEHAKNQESFYGSQRNPARMWQDPDSLLAPVIEIDRTQNTLKAGGENTAGAPVVTANFTTTVSGQQPAGVVRVRSQSLVYADRTRQADFRGSVTATQGDESIHADDAVLYLRPAAVKSGSAESTDQANAKSAAKQNSQLDRIVATGNVLFTQPGRRGNGEKLVYTANDGRYMLSGTEGSQPRLWDRVHGTTTGEALIFSSQDDKIEVRGGKSSAVTETRAKK